MTFREKLKREHPEMVNEKYFGGCKGCPKSCGYEDNLPNCFFECGECWNREIPESEALSGSEIPNNSDTISRQAVIDMYGMSEGFIGTVKQSLEGLPSAHPEPLTESEVIICKMFLECKAIGSESCNEYKLIMDLLDGKRSAQPEHTCLTCGRTANNGGWYKDGRTRCPIEEHYTLPKDGHCHLWEKQKPWEDDYPERRADV